MFHKQLRVGALLFFTAMSMVCTQPLSAAYVIKGGRPVDKRDVATKSVQEHYSIGMQALQEKDWREVVAQFRKVVGSFPGTSFAKDGLYYLGIGYFHRGDFDLANKHLSKYLKENTSSKHFEDALKYKLAIAEQFRQGAGRHLFGMESLPRWLPARSQAVDVYDEVINALPSHELASQALFAKGNLLLSMKRYQEAVDSFQMLINRFPKSELVSESYQSIADVLCKQSSYQANNPDLIPLAEINLRKFKEHLPRDERLEEIEQKMAALRETNARGLYDTGRFYERINQQRASVIYYVSAMRRFPETETATECRKRLRALSEYTKELDLPEEYL